MVTNSAEIRFALDVQEHDRADHRQGADHERNDDAADVDDAVLPSPPSTGPQSDRTARPR